MPRYRLDFAYDGSGFHGYAIQPDLRTVQGVLEEALVHHTGPIETSVAGRTDRGVHATAQVVSFDTEGPIDTDRTVRSLNRQLAPEIAVHRLTEVTPDFHARFSATGRAYRYRIHNGAVHDPFRSKVVWHYVEQLDSTAMDQASRVLVGEHDFASFCRRYGNRPTTRRVQWAGWHRLGDDVDLSIGAASFCHQMVRSIVAVSVEIGRGRLRVADMAAILAERDRSVAKGVAPPEGLSLVAVSYGDESLPRPGWIPET